MNGGYKSGLQATPWNTWDIVKAVVVAVAVVALVFGVAVIVPLVLGADFHGRAGTVFLAAVTGLAEAALLLAAWMFSVHKYKVGWLALGFRRFRGLPDLVTALGVVGLFFLVNWVYAIIILLLGLKFLLPEQSVPTFGGGLLGLLLTLAVAAIVAPLAEEAFFRGFVFGGLRGRVRLAWAAAFSAGLFAISHLQISVVIPIFVLGLLLAWLYYQTSSLWSCIFAHALYNGTALVISFVITSRGGL